jgi:hypothetical protein
VLECIAEKLASLVMVDLLDLAVAAQLSQGRRNSLTLDLLGKKITQAQ